MNAPSSPLSSSRTKLANALLLLVVTAASLWLADLGFRAYERNFLVPKLPEPGSDDPVNLAALRYNESWVERGTEAGEFRVLSFGDSFGYSVMEPALSYNGVAERVLQSALPERELRIVNLGEPATGTRQYRESYRYWSEVLEHQAALFMIFIGNDLLDDAYLYTAIEWQPNRAVLEGGNAILDPGNPRVPRKFPLRMADYAYAWWMSRRTRSDDPLPPGYNWAGLTDFDEETFISINARYLENFDPVQLPRLMPGYEQVLRLLEDAASIMARGIPVAIAIGPSEVQVDDALRARVLAENGRESEEFDMRLPLRLTGAMQQAVAPGVPLFDLTADFRSYAQHTGHIPFFRRNTHWDREGNRLAGEVIAARLMEAWFGEARYKAPNDFEPLPDNPLLSDAEIAAYVARITGGSAGLAARVDGAVRGIQLIDGIHDEPENWGIAPHGQPITVQFSQSFTPEALKIDLFDADGRRYRVVVEVRTDAGWQTVHESDAGGDFGLLEVAVQPSPVSAIRISGLSDTADPASGTHGHLLIHEVRWTQKEAESGY